MNSDKTRVDLILETPGKSITRLVDTLKPALKTNVQTIAQKVFRTPSTLIENLDHSKANQIKALLTEIGASVQIVDTGTFKEIVSAEHEIALIPGNMASMPTVLQELLLLLRVPVEQACEFFKRSPVVIMGKLSRNSADAIQNIFAAYGARVVVSDRSTAKYDLYLKREASYLRNDIAIFLKRHRISHTQESSKAEQPMIASGISAEHADLIWEHFSKSGSNLKIINRAFYSFDLRWSESASESEDSSVASYLNQHFGIPEALYPKLKVSKNLVLAEDLTVTEVESHMASLGELGASCIADLTTLQSYSCKLIETGDTETTFPAIELITGMKKADALHKSKAPGSLVLPGLTKHQARWLQHAVQSAGGKIEIKAGN